MYYKLITFTPKRKTNSFKNTVSKYKNTFLVLLIIGSPFPLLFFYNYYNSNNKPTIVKINTNKELNITNSLPPLYGKPATRDIYQIKRATLKRTPRHSKFK